MDTPFVITAPSFQSAYAQAGSRLVDNAFSQWNLVVQITDPSAFCPHTNRIVDQFAQNESLITPKGVCYTIFPFRLQERTPDRERFFQEYLDRFYPKVRKVERNRRNFTSWGTYFHRMIAYPGENGGTNQLENIIVSLRSRERHSHAAYTVLIAEPGSETTRPLGSPCLNYIAVQIDHSAKPRLGLLAVYRNHDFLERAYGNYWGLSKLLLFLSGETGFQPGTLTCISSHAYVPGKKKAFREFIRGLPS